MSHLTDEELMAWADEQLDADASARVEAALKDAPDLHARGLAMRKFRQQLHATFAAELAEPAPDSLMRAARGLTPAVRAQPLPQSFPIRQVARHWAQWGGLAAGLLLVAGLATTLSGGEKLLAVQDDGRVVADGALADALDKGLTGQPQRAGVRLHLSFKDAHGNYCRIFHAPVGSGLACHEARHWQVVALSAPPAAPEPEREMRLAGNELPPLVLEAAQRRIAGHALDEREEREARDQAWQR